MKNTITVTMRFPKKWIECLKKEARKKAYKEDIDFSYLNLIREIVAVHLAEKEKQ